MSPVTEACDALRALHASWQADVGQPAGPGSIAGSDLRTASDGPFNDLLLRIGAGLGTRDRRTIAAAFALAPGVGGGDGDRAGPASRVRARRRARRTCPSSSSRRRPGAHRHPRARGTLIAGNPRASHPAVHHGAGRRGPDPRAPPRSSWRRRRRSWTRCTSGRGSRAAVRGASSRRHGRRTFTTLAARTG